MGGASAPESVAHKNARVEQVLVKILFSFRGKGGGKGEKRGNVKKKGKEKIKRLGLSYPRNSRSAWQWGKVLTGRVTRTIGIRRRRGGGETRDVRGNSEKKTTRDIHSGCNGVLRGPAESGWELRLIVSGSVARRRKERKRLKATGGAESMVWERKCVCVPQKRGQEKEERCEGFAQGGRGFSSS